MRWSDFHRLRKYRRKVASALRLPGRSADRLLALKWRYWHKLYGPHQLLWAAGE